MSAQLSEQAQVCADTVLCICTYNRPQGLYKLLMGIASLDAADGLQIVVVDNDEKGEGAQVCSTLPDDYPFVVHASVENTAGISHARNAAVNKALTLNPTWLVFLDDDETPSQQWLAELKRIQYKTNADAVGGPTLSVFPENTPDNVRENPYYGADLSIEDGAQCQLQAAGNFLIRAASITKMAPEFFHPAFAKSGGEDLAFFTQLAQQGLNMHWAANAIVHEDVPSNRLSEQWMKERVVNIANSRVRVMQMLQPGFAASVIRVIKTAALFTVAMLYTVAGFIHPTLKMKSKMLRWKFWGKFTAHFNLATTRGDGH